MDSNALIPFLLEVPYYRSTGKIKNGICKEIGQYQKLGEQLKSKGEFTVNSNIRKLFVVQE